MKYAHGNIWDYYNKGHLITITTNGTVKNGKCVMGAGIALQAKQKFPEVPEQLGKLIQEFGNIPFFFSDINLITIPTKHEFFNRFSDIKLIEKGLIWLNKFQTHRLLNLAPTDTPEICVTQFGTANGHLDWNIVKPIMEKHLNDMFVCVELL